MGNTQRTYEKLETILEDNDTNAIIPQDLRDLAVSMMGNWAWAFIDNNTGSPLINFRGMKGEMNPGMYRSTWNSLDSESAKPGCI
jgi:hypothetical protein